MLSNEHKCVILLLVSPKTNERVKEMGKNSKGWAIAIVVIALLALIGSCDDSKKEQNGNLKTGYCSHCHGSGVTKYGNECGWCNGTGYWAFYD